MENVKDWRLSTNQQEVLEPRLDEANEELVYRSLRNYWHPVAYTSDVDNEPLAFQLLDTQLVMVRVDGEVHVYNDLCAHRGTALSLGCVTERGTLRCPHHGWEYDVDGLCMRIPQRQDLVEQLSPRILKFKSVEQGGLVWACLEDEPRFPVPRFPHHDDDSFDKIAIPEPEWGCSAVRRTENYTDLSHFAIVHDGLLGDVNHPEVPEHRTWREDDGVLRMELLEAQLEPTATVKNAAISVSDSLAEIMKQWHIYMPLTVLLETTQPSGEQYVLFFHPTPVSRHRTANFTIAARNFGDANKLQSEVVEFGQEVYSQDRPIVESQRPNSVPVDLSREIYLRDAEVLAVQYRRWMIELATEFADSD